MSGRVCLTPDQAFDAGFAEPCEHNVPDPEDCSRCRLTITEIQRLSVLFRGSIVRPAQHSSAA